MMAVQVFECSATSFGTSCHRNLSNSPASLTSTFSSPFSNTRTLLVEAALDYKASTQQQGPGSTLELWPQNLDRFRTLQKANRDLQAELKLSQKRSRQG